MISSYRYLIENINYINIYHRTTESNLSEVIKTKSLIAGFGNEGIGVYGYYDLSSTMNRLGNISDTEHDFGNVIIKATLNVTNKDRFLFFDTNVLSGIEPLEFQMKRFDMINEFEYLKHKYPNIEYITNYNRPNKIIDSSEDSVNSTVNLIADLQYKFHDFVRKLHNKCDGLFFTDYGYGHVAVIFKESSITPIEYCTTENYIIINDWREI